MDLKDLDDEELVNLYPELLKELKNRDIIRTNNLVGELGEYHAHRIYKKDTSLPQLQLNLKSTKNIDATSVRGERYAIKSTSGNGTGVFASLPKVDDGVVHFEYLIIVIFNKDYTVKGIFELSWKQFLEFRKMKQPENKWNVPITSSLKKSAKIIL